MLLTTPRTLETNTYMVRKCIQPAFGDLTVDAIAVEHVKDWFASMAVWPGAANRALPVLSMMMRMAELWGYRRGPCIARMRQKNPSEKVFCCGVCKLCEPCRRERFPGEMRDRSKNRKAWR